MKIRIIKLMSIISIIITIHNICVLNTKRVFAMSDVTETIDVWITEEDQGETELNNKIEPVLKIIRTVGIIISVLSFSIIGLKMVLLSVEEKAAYKQALMPWVTGAILVFAMTTLPSMIYTFIGEENMVGKDMVSVGNTIKGIIYCPVDGAEITDNNCPNYEECRVTKENGEKGHKCSISGCGSRAWPFRGGYLCPKCGTYFNY